MKKKKTKPFHLIMARRTVYLAGNISKSNGRMMRALKESLSCLVIAIFDLIYFKKDTYF